MSYEDQRSWSDKQLDTAKELLKNNAFYFISFDIADEESDTKRATDLVIKVNGGDIAVRARKDTGFRDFTLRTRAQYGGKTEIDKIREGFAKWYLYIWFEGGALANYLIVDIDKLRQSGLLDSVESIVNHDGCTSFTAISISDLVEHGCVVYTDLVT